MERKSDGEKSDEAKERSGRAKSDGAAERQSDRWTGRRSEERRSDGATERVWISLYIKIEKRKKKKINCVGRSGWSERATEKRAAERKSNGAKSNGATERRSNRSM